MPVKSLWQDDYYVTISDLVRAGHTEVQIAEHLNVTPRTLKGWATKRPALQRILDHGGEVVPSQKRELQNLQEFEILKPNQRAYLQAYVETCLHTGAQRATGLSMGCHYYWLRTSEEYEAAFKLAEGMVKDRCVDEMTRRAIIGVERYRFDKNGNPLVNPDTGEFYKEREYSDTLLIFKLKAMDPNTYRENVKHDHDHKHSGTVLHDLLQATDPAESIVDAEYVKKETQRHLEDQR